jgi:hypothetical protein
VYAPAGRFKPVESICRAMLSVWEPLNVPTAQAGWVYKILLLTPNGPAPPVNAEYPAPLTLPLKLVKGDIGRAG